MTENLEEIQRQVAASSSHRDKFKLAASMWKDLALVEKAHYVAKYQQMSNQRKSMIEKLLAVQKKPPSALCLFAQSVHQTNGWFEHLANCAILWKQLDEEQKQKFVSEAGRLKLEHDAKMAALTEEELFALEKLSNARKKHKLISEFGRPKKAVSAFRHFAKSFVDAGQFLQAKNLATEKWKNMTVNEKEPFFERANADHERYKAELKLWKAEMVAKGQTDVLTLKPKKERQRRILSVPKPLKSQLPKRAKLASQKWHEMSEAEKKPFYDETVEVHKKYRAHLELWRRKMIENRTKKP